MPNMDEVVREIKEYLAIYENQTLKDEDWLFKHVRLLIEERERLNKHEMTLINQFNETMGIFQKNRIELESRLAEQDKEIQKYKSAVEIVAKALTDIISVDDRTASDIAKDAVTELSNL